MKTFRYIVIDPVKFVIKDLMVAYYILLGAVAMALLYILPNDKAFTAVFVLMLIAFSVLFFALAAACVIISQLLLHAIISIHPRWRKKLKEHIEKVCENDNESSL